MQNQHDLHPHDKAYYMFICLIHIKIVAREKKNRDRHMCLTAIQQTLFLLYNNSNNRKNNPITPLLCLLKSPCFNIYQWFTRDDGVPPLSKSPVSQSLLASFMTFFFPFIFYSFVEYLALFETVQLSSPILM